ncbi:MAG: hypothetical protein MIO93_10600, partial [ANME-2 cluster archaeon]|nr:hypothetical protein [ANME-2 cluster archaeon]
MDNIRKFYLALAIAVIALVGIAIAVVPPPPANQLLGIPDTTFDGFTEPECRECHTATGTAIGEDPNLNSLPDRHHWLVASGDYACLDCHPIVTNPDGTQNITTTRDCLECHLSTPHHNTIDAQDRHCSACHGSLVDDYDDGHYIPTYLPSLVTPDTSFIIQNATTGKKWGGCEGCHENQTKLADGTPIGPIDLNYDIKENYETHHNLDTVSTNCNYCHDFSAASSIRQCETCHGVKSLHNIQYDYTNTSGTLGYGHIGDNWDCNGCHAFWDAGAAPMEGPITPSLDTVSADGLVAGQSTVLRLEGSNFVTTTGSTTYTSDVVVNDGANPVTLTPDSITGSEIIVTIPPLDAGVYGLYVVKADMKSKLVPIFVSPDVTITSAVKDGDNVVIKGAGFGEQLPEPFDTLVSVTVLHKVNKNKIVELPTNIVSWSPTQIMVNCPEASSEDVATLNALFGSASAEITVDSDPTPTETPTPRPTRTPKPPK